MQLLSPFVKHVDCDYFEYFVVVVLVVVLAVVLKKKALIFKC